MLSDPHLHMTAAPAPIPTEHTDEINARILAVSEDCVKGFNQHPFQYIAEQSGLTFDTVIERIRAMLATDETHNRGTARSRGQAAAARLASLINQGAVA